MDYDNKLIHARLDAIEDILLSLASGKSIGDIRTELFRQHEIARQQMKRSQQDGGFQREVNVQARVPRDTDGEAARLEAYERIGRKFKAL